MTKDIQQLHQSQTPPPLFERGAPMWNDPYIAEQMLSFHLDTSHDIASRHPETVNQTVQWTMQKLNLSAGMRLLDLGCGPGLYTSRFSTIGLEVTGVDYSKHSIDYARQHDSVSIYLCQDYTSLDIEVQTFDVIMMVYGDFCVLSNEERDTLLATIGKLLKSNGHFVFDVTTPQFHDYLDSYNHWSVEPNGGFWKASPYLVLEQGFSYPENIRLHQYIVIEDSGIQTIYRNWYHDYTADTLSSMLVDNGYTHFEVFGDLQGTGYTHDSDWCAVIVQNKGLI